MQGSTWIYLCEYEYGYTSMQLAVNRLTDKKISLI